MGVFSKLLSYLDAAVTQGPKLGCGMNTAVDHHLAHQSHSLISTGRSQGCGKVTGLKSRRKSCSHTQTCTVCTSCVLDVDIKVPTSF